MNAIELTYYHFTGDKLRDGSPIPPIGEWLEYSGRVVMCSSGLHASAHPLDALQYAPGPLLHRVELDGLVESQADKVVAQRRKIIASIDATDLLRLFARKRALSVIHLWNAPQVVKDYLNTGDEKLRAAAWDAARAGAGAGDAGRQMLSEMVDAAFAETL